MNEKGLGKILNMDQKGLGNLKLNTDQKGLWTNGKYGLKGLQIILNMDDQKGLGTNIKYGLERVIIITIIDYGIERVRIFENKYGPEQVRKNIKN